MEAYQKKFNAIEIISDESNGLIKLDLIDRHGQDRATKVLTNFIGHLRPVKPQFLREILEILNTKLPTPQTNEIVVGQEGSAVTMAYALAEIRNTPFNYGIPQEFGDITTVCSFTEEHRNKRPQYLYGVTPGDSIVVIEDEVTSGEGVITAIKALQAYGCTVVAVASVIENTNFNAREKILNETGLELQSLCKIKLT